MVTYFTSDAPCAAVNPTTQSLSACDITLSPLAAMSSAFAKASIAPWGGCLKFTVYLYTYSPIILRISSVVVVIDFLLWYCLSLLRSIYSLSIISPTFVP